MNIIIGICGLNHGHCTRQWVIVSYLLERGHNLLLTVSNSSETFFAKHYPQIPRVCVDAPIISCNGNGIDWTKTHKKAVMDLFKKFTTSCRQIQALMPSTDLVISDYEPICAWYSYAQNIPLITLDNQSLFLGYKTEDVGIYTRKEESRRLSFCFPNADFRIATSFCRVNDKKTNYEVEVIGATISNDIINLKVNATKKANIKPQIVVYMNPLSSLDKYKELVSRLAECEVDIILFSQERLEGIAENVLQCRYNRGAFLEAISNADCVVLNAGNQLISECLLLEKPMFLFPAQKYEQQYNAVIVERNNMGVKFDIDNIDKAKFISALSRISELRDGIKRYKAETKYEKRVNEVLQILTERFGV
jgi:uncharacterized protein (TIGR00661 family)